MNKEQKIKTLENQVRLFMSQIRDIEIKLRRNQEKITAEGYTVKRLESNLAVHKRNVFELENYKKREEPKKVRLQADLKKAEKEIVELRREINRDKISG